MQKKVKSDLLKSAKGVLKAWDSLEGNKNYSSSEIEEWLTKQMSPSIRKLRKILKLKS